MALPNQPVTLSIEQVKQLNDKLSTMRHDINNHLSLVVASLELMRYRPDVAEERLKAIAEQPARITEALKLFSAEFEATLGIKRP